MAAQNPEVYYSDSDNHGSYVYVSLEEMVNNFMLNYTGDGTILRNIKRHQVIYQMKKGIQQFTFNALREVRKAELELGETLDITLPMDYVAYTRISYVNPETGQLMDLSLNPNIAIGTAFLQDHNADILFDDDGLILEGTTYFEELNDAIATQSTVDLNCGCNGEQRFTLDLTQNANGYFNIDTRTGKIHFSSDNAPRVIILEYISDGLQYSDESDIKINKMAEIALYDWTQYNLTHSRSGVQEYIVKRMEKKYIASFRNTKIAMMNINLNDTMLVLNGKKKSVK